MAKKPNTSGVKTLSKEKSKIDVENLHFLHSEINKALHQCLRSATPNVCAKAETKEGYIELETELIFTCIIKALTPKQAIALLESELSNNE